MHTDDIARAHSGFGWADLLIEGILVPARQGGPVSYRPPRWAERGREGSIEIGDACPLLPIEGDGAGRPPRMDGRGNALQRRPANLGRADGIVCGTPEIACDPVTEIVVSPPLHPPALPSRP